ncbi:MAG: twin-arginine translocase TatA/TatE family subunit [Elusimicrobia bacterium]|nr:twin-arginine translocase TatA/TatE family subunit [Elusimicrobiota bacterium]
MLNLGWIELLVILGVFLLLFGAKRIPEIARALGSSAHAFKSGLRENDDEIGGEKHPEKTPAE